MALTFTEKTQSYDSTDLTTYTTASVTATANRLYLIGMYASGTNPDITAVSGAGLGSWVLEKEDLGAGRSIEVWRAASASPGAGAAISITVGGTGISGCAWSVIEIDGQDTSGTNGSGAIVQSVSATGTSTSGNATLAAYGASGNRPVAWLGTAANTALTPELTGGTNVLGAGPNTTFQGEWSTSTQDTTPSFSWTGSTAYRTIAIEIKAAVAVTNVFSVDMLGV